MDKIFVYGTLQDPEVQKHILGRARPLQDDVLKGYRKGNIEINGRSYFIAIPEAGSQIEGKVIEASPKEILLMDEYETKAYKRIKVKLASGQRAWLYCRP
jgi:gamma-glutamylcyclotransferase (GGCT)/AIG2-like uncharacterized protein YtfP